MEPSLPEWVTKEFFEQCLRKEEGNPNIVVTNLTASSAVPPGNNYGSFIIRVALDWEANEGESEGHSSKFIVKAELTEGPMKDMVADFVLFEPSFYYKFIPKAKQFCSVNFAAKSFFSPKSTVTILEDLKEKGFVMVDRTKQLDLDHCRLYMIAAALFHSVSVPVFKKYPELLEPMKKEVMYSNESNVKDLFQLLLQGSMKRVVQEMENIDRFKKYTNLIRNLTPCLWDLLVEAHEPCEIVNTIKQGDPWSTNMMFKYDGEGKVCDIKIIDFQATGYGSPVADIMTFIWSSATIEVKKNDLEELYRVYLEHFNENLKQFNCTERLTYEQMMGNVKKFSPLALFVSCCLYPCMNHPHPMDFSMLYSEDKDTQVDKFYDKYYNDAYCSNILPQVLDTLEANGIFTYFENYKNKK